VSVNTTLLKNTEDPSRATHFGSESFDPVPNLGENPADAVRKIGGERAHTETNCRQRKNGEQDAQKGAKAEFSKKR
jgi:hypothetical protein